MTTTFAQLGLPDSLVQALSKRDISEPFPVQEATIPDALAGMDVCGKAPTGSGKTLAFGLPLLTNVEKAKRNRPRALILAPTRELAEQIKKELVPLGRATGRQIAAIYGGVGYGPQKNALRKGVDVLVATPGRLEDLMEQGSVNLGQVDIVVVDEADRMADMGFMPAVRRILDSTSRKRQTLLFSATLDGDIAVLSRDYQHDPVRHEAGTIEPETIDARHHFWLVQQHERTRHTADLVDSEGRSIVFTRTRHGADRLARQLGKLGVGAVAMHGGRSQSQRNKALRDFSTGRAQALIATDVAARGIHIDAVATVIHFDPPADHKDYLHRSGRTARAGATGTIVSLVTSEQRKTVRRMQQDLGLQAAPIDAPEFDELESGGHRIGKIASTSSGRNERPRSRNRSRRSSKPERSNRERSNGERTDRNRAGRGSGDRDRTNEGRSNGERSNGDRSNRRQGERERSNEGRSNGDRSGRDSANGERRNGDRPNRRQNERERSNGKTADAGQSVYVANLPWKATERDVEKLFARYGDVHQTTIITDRRTGRSKGFAFVDMAKPAARTAIEALDGTKLGGRDLKVHLARPSARTRT